MSGSIASVAVARYLSVDFQHSEWAFLLEQLAKFLCETSYAYGLHLTILYFMARASWLGLILSCQLLVRETMRSCGTRRRHAIYGSRLSNSSSYEKTDVIYTFVKV